jgi:hypothetical protein
MSISKLWTAALVAAALTVAGYAQAAPVYYEFTGGSAVVRLTVGASTLASSAALDLNGVFATFDSDGDGNLVDFEFALEPEQGLSFSFPLGGYDSIVIHSATLQPGAGYANTFNADNGGGNYSVIADQILTTTSLDVIDTTPGGLSPEAFMFAGNSIDPLVATIDVASGTTFTLDGIALGSFTNADFPTIPAGVSVVVKLDLTFEGMIPVPEPTMGVLFGFGLAVVAALRARRI